MKSSGQCLAGKYNAVNNANVHDNTKATSPRQSIRTGKTPREHTVNAAAAQLLSDHLEPNGETEFSPAMRQSIAE